MHFDQWCSDWKGWKSEILLRLHRAEENKECQEKYSNPPNDRAIHEGDNFSFWNGTCCHACADTYQIAEIQRRDSVVVFDLEAVNHLNLSNMSNTFCKKTQWRLFIRFRFCLSKHLRLWTVQ
jgi:hypothetical protein